jgi:hypothetical protein
MAGVIGKQKIPMPKKPPTKWEKAHATTYSYLSFLNDLKKNTIDITTDKRLRRSVKTGTLSPSHSSNLTPP